MITPRTRHLVAVEMSEGNNIETKCRRRKGILLLWLQRTDKVGDRKAHGNTGRKGVDGHYH